MQTDNPILDDLARVANGALGVAAGLREEVESLVRQRLARLLDEMDLVPREEFEAVREMAANARAEQERLEKRVAALETAVGGTARGGSRAAAGKGARKSSGRSAASGQSGRRKTRGKTGR